MDPADLRRRIAAQFAGRGERADIWRAFALLFPTEAYLNLGYSRWYEPHFLGSSQRRLARVVGDELADRLDATAGVPLVDVGCGRGGPAFVLAERHGFDVTGVDLVRANVQRARANAEGARPNARQEDVPTAFLVGDATALPLHYDSVRAATAIDTHVYVPDMAAAVAELGAVVREGGIVVCSDLVHRTDAGQRADDAVAAFADAWDMAPPRPVREYRAAFADAGLEVLSVRDITGHSVGRFRKYTLAVRRLDAGPVAALVTRLCRRRGLDPTAVRSQIDAAHRALPALGHVLVVARA